MDFVYSLVSSLTSEYFMIDAETGVISVRKSLVTDPEKETKYTVKTNYMLVCFFLQICISILLYLYLYLLEVPEYHYRRWYSLTSFYKMRVCNILLDYY